MGNAVTKEQDVNRRSRGLSASSASISGNVSLPFSQPAALARKIRKEKERDQQREEQAWNLVVRFEESVDGGYLAPYGTYKSNLDYKADLVRSLIIERKLAPFYTPLQDFNPSWTDEELLAALDKLPLHADLSEEAEEEEEDMDNHKLRRSGHSVKKMESKRSKERIRLKALKWQEEAEAKYHREKQNLPPKRSLFLPSKDLQLKLYRESMECPICFVYYPPYLNISRCCIQPICSECFVQIKRLDPHHPHDEEGNETDTEIPEALISEPAKCPFCAMPDFGVTYYPPNFRVGIDGSYPNYYKNTDTTTINEDGHLEQQLGSTSPKSPTSISDAINKTRSAIGTPPRHSNSLSAITREYAVTTSTSSLSMASAPTENEDGRTRRRRQGSLPPTTPGVITTDFIRPDWENKLRNARLKVARRSAAASAIHASSLLYDHHLGDNRQLQQQQQQQQQQVPQRRALVTAHRERSETMELEERMIEEALRLSLLEQDHKDVALNDARR